jgi:serine phosphatase RsbU (regulator of sigma subunit)
MDRDAFLTQICVAAFRMLIPPDLAPRSSRMGFLTFIRDVWRGLRPRRSVCAIDPSSDRGTARDYSARCCPYEVWTKVLPCEPVGGDWLRVDAGSGEDIWVIVADVTGHGYPAHIVAAGLPYLWQLSHIAERRLRGCPPRELLDALGRELEPVLPDGVFVEATLGRFAPDGSATLAGAGVCRVVLRRSGRDRLTLHDLGGALLGFQYGGRDQQDLTLRAGDQLALASDGLFEQPDGDDCQLRERLADRAGARLLAGRTLHDAILDVLKETIASCPQRDDVTVITVHFTGRVAAVQGGYHVVV